jgi:hypothetical protein
MSDQFLTRQVSRRDFNAASLTALFVGMSVWVGACGSSGGSNNASYSASPTAPTPTPTPTPTSASPTPAASPSDKSGTVSDNHGHAATVTGVQLQAGGAVSLHIQGGADHDHTVDLTADQVAQVALGTRVTKASTLSAGGSDGYGGYSTPTHNHSVTFN